MLPDAIVFDLDGTVADTESIEFRSVARVWEDHGLVFAEERWAHVIGQSWSPQWAGDLVAEAKTQRTIEVLVDDLHRLQAEYKAGMLLELAPRPGIVELLHAAREAGVPLGIASNSTSDWVEMRLAQLGLRHHFATVSAVDNVDAPKPDAAPYRQACERLGARPSHSVAFEDSTTGVASAVAAGLFTIACAGPLTTGHDLGRAQLVIGSHEELTFAAVCAALAAFVDEAPT